MLLYVVIAFLLFPHLDGKTVIGTLSLWHFSLNPVS